MKNVAQMIPRASRALQSTQPLPPATQPLGVVDDQTGEIIERIFRQLQAIFPAHKQAWPDDNALKSARRSWTKGFVDAGIRTIEQVRFGIEQCRRSGSPFAPSIGQFIEWCTPGPEHFGMPAVADAWMEALMETYSHPAVKAAANATGLFDLRSARQENKGLRERFERNYQIVLRRVQAGLPMDGKILVGIGHDSQKTELELANERAEREAQERIAKQGIPADGKSARELLISKFGSRRASL
jgi:hypothetical protein